MGAHVKQHQITTGQARKGIRVGHPELSIECPQCHSVAGRRCFMNPGLLGITHAVRQMTYLRQARAAALLQELRKYYFFIPVQGVPAKNCRKDLQLYFFSNGQLPCLTPVFSDIAILRKNYPDAASFLKCRAWEFVFTVKGDFANVDGIAVDPPTGTVIIRDDFNYLLPFPG